LPPTWQATQARGGEVCAPSSANPTPECVNVAGCQLVVPWQTWQLVGNPLAACGGLCVESYSCWWQATHADGVPA
jgi:hypothetical protein